MSESSTARKVGTVVLLFLLVAGGGLAYLGYTDYKDTKSSLDNRVETDGVITSTNVVERERVDKRRDRIDEKTVYSPSVEYNYTYENKTYSGDDITASEVQINYASRGKAESLLEDYPEGENVTVYLDSRNPEDSFLEKRGSGNSLKIILIGVGFFLISLLLLVSKLFR